MRLVGLISGGKDSIYNMLQCISAGHEIVAVANIEPEKKEELDSYMYQSVGHQVVSLIAGALALPLYRQKTVGHAKCKNKTYRETGNDEVEDLVKLLTKVKKDVHFDGVSVGAIASDYQRNRVENVCCRFNLKCFAYLWKRDQEELLQEMIDSEVDAIIIKVASIGLKPDVHLGMHIKDMKNILTDLNKKFGVNVCGEGGEYETLTLDCPLFHRVITITDSENVILSNDAFAPVAYYNVKSAALETKIWEDANPVQSVQERLSYIKSIVPNPYFFVQDCVDEVSFNIFPQRPKRNLSQDLPFPFASSRDEDQSSNVQEYWKKSDSARPHSTQKMTLSPSYNLSIVTTNCNLNYSTGWSCFGNVAGKTLFEALTRLQKNLEMVKYEFQDVVFVNLFVRDMGKFASMNKTYCQFIPEIMPPARVCVETVLPPDTDVLLMVVAHKLVSKSQKFLHSSHTQKKEVLHVQSISHWAPANIGPYSQCVKIGEIYYLAGQIPLIPGTMEILNKPIFHQCKLALRHVLRVMQAVNENLNYLSILTAICYVTSEAVACDIQSLWSYITKNEDALVAAVVVTGLPAGAQLEWEVLACGIGNREINETNSTVEDYLVQMRRCVHSKPFTSSLLCKVAKKPGKAQKTLRTMSLNGILLVLKQCLQYLRTDCKTSGTLLCMLRIFYKASDADIAVFIGEIIKSGLGYKVVVTGIPVRACQEPDTFLTITGVCH